MNNGCHNKSVAGTSVPFLVKAPIDPAIVLVSDSGKPYMFQYTTTKTARAFDEVILPILEMESFVVSTKSKKT